MTRRQTSREASADTILKLGCMKFPVDNEDIDYFEETKDGKMSINVWEISRTQLHYSK